MNLVENDYLNQPGFIEFTKSDFDPAFHAHELLGKNASLQYNLEFIKKQINRKVKDSQESLLESVKDLQYMETVVDEISAYCDSLFDSYNKLKTLVKRPFDQLKMISKDIKNQDESSEELRAIQQFLVTFERFELLAKEGEEERAATYLYQLEKILEKPSLSDLVFIGDQVRATREMGRNIRTIGRDLIEKGIAENVIRN
jgi:hypothetical protein